MKVISLGAGVQSSTMALMASCGELEQPDFAVFADTQWEPQAVYRWIDSLEPMLSFPIYRTTIGSLRDHLKAAQNSTGQRIAAVPFFMDGGRKMGRRQCTHEYKLAPIRRLIREKGGEKVELWLGISVDEIHRMKPSRLKWITNRWPLIEKRMSRQDCLAWLSDHGYEAPPRSSCLGCPYHSDSYWRSLRETSPEEWNDTVEMDRIIRDQPKFHEQQFMHRSCKPLDEIDFSDNGQLDLFGEECEGMCGV